jgi:hypothetical protein
MLLDGLLVMLIHRWLIFLFTILHFPVLHSNFPVNTRLNKIRRQAPDLLSFAFSPYNPSVSSIERGGAAS